MLIEIRLEEDVSVISIKREISNKRTQIMGIASLGIILVHSIDIVAWSPNLEKLFGFGGTGVYIFVFLSAIGLFHSLKSRGGEKTSLNSTKGDLRGL